VSESERGVLPLGPSSLAYFPYKIKEGLFLTVNVTIKLKLKLRFEVSIAVKCEFFWWVVMLFNLVDGYQYFKGMYCLQSFTLKMECDEFI
jgi:hypothetical protein